MSTLLDEPVIRHSTASPAQRIRTTMAAEQAIASELGKPVAHLTERLSGQEDEPLSNLVDEALN